MRVCSNCFENDLLVNIKFTRNKSLLRFLGVSDVCSKCESILLERHRFTINDSKIEYKKVQLTIKTMGSLKCAKRRP